MISRTRAGGLTLRDDQEPSLGVRRWGPIDIVTAAENRHVVLKLLKHAVALAVGPIGTCVWCTVTPLMTILRSFLLVRDLQPPEHPYRDARAAIAAVLVTNLLIASYVVMAFREEDPPGLAPQPGVRRLGRWQERRAE